VGDDGSTSDIWFGEIREEIINIFESGGIPEMCKDCEISNNFAKKID
jgi:hypothetical protein